MSSPDSHMPTEGDFRDQIERITASATFNRSDRLAHFLRFASDAALRQDAHSLKEWVIGVEVYGRGDNFDPRIDSIVRTEARRLRRKLKEYYESEGREDPVLIELPTGSYEPVFRVRTENSTPPKAGEEQIEERIPSGEAPPARSTESPPLDAEPAPLARDVRILRNFRNMSAQHWRNTSIVLSILLALLLFALVRERISPPLDAVHRLAVMPPRYESIDTDGEQLVNAFVQDLATKLGLERDVTVMEPGSSPQLAHQEPSIKRIASALKADHVLLITGEKSDSSYHVTARLIRASDAVPVWIEGFRSSWNEIATDESQTLNDLLAYIFANSRASRPPADIAAFQAWSPERAQAYTDAAKALGRFSVSEDKLESDYAAHQLALALTMNPQFDDARVLLARLRLEQLFGTPERERLLGEVISSMEGVLNSEPKRADAMALLGEAYWERGDQDRGMHLVQQALDLEPLNPISRSAIGRLYVELGFFESAIVENDKAFALNRTNVSALALNILCFYWTNKLAEARRALNTLREWSRGTQVELFMADEQLRSGNFVEAGRLISMGRELATADERAPFEIADGLRLALMGNRPEARRVWEQYKDSRPGFWDHLILLAAQISEANSAVHLISQNRMYANYRYLVAERRLSPLYKEPAFQALLDDCYSKWLADLKRYGSSLPIAPPSLPSPEILKQP